MSQKRKRDIVTSPVGWFAVTYVEQFVRVSLKHRKTTPCWVYENTILVKAKDAVAAYDKCLKEKSRLCLGEYKEAYDESIKYEGSFVGILSMTPLFDDLADFCEISWSKYRTTSEKLGETIPSRDELVFVGGGKGDRSI